MPSDLGRFEIVARRSGSVTQATFAPADVEHPFDARNIHPDFPDDVRRLFDNGHYSQATFEAMKFLDNEVKRHATSSDFGKALMMKAFNEASPLIRLNNLSTETERNGFKFLFAGSMLAIRNPRGHEHSIQDSPDNCLDHLSLASLLLRRLANAGFK